MTILVNSKGKGKLEVDLVLPLSKEQEQEEKYSSQKSTRGTTSEQVKKKNEQDMSN